MENETQSEGRLWQQKIVRVYLSGFLCLAIIYVGWRVLEQFSPLFRLVENPFVALLLTILILILVPPFLGSLVQFGLNPILGKWNTCSQLITGQKWARFMSPWRHVLSRGTFELFQRICYRTPDGRSSNISFTNGRSVLLHRRNWCEANNKTRSRIGNNSES